MSNVPSRFNNHRWSPRGRPWPQGMVWNVMENETKWNGTEILVWNMDDASMRWKTILHIFIQIPYQISLMAITENIYG